MTIQKIPIDWPDAIQFGIWQFLWPFESGTETAWGVAALLCDGPFLYAPFDTPEAALAYEIDDTYCNSEPSECTPSEPLEFTAGRDQLVSHKRLTFSINGSPPSIFTGLAEVGDDDADISFEDYFYRFGTANRVEGNYFIISTNGGNQGAFRLGFDSESGQAIISARDDSHNPLSTTLELIATNHPDDFAIHYFGGSVMLHACGISEPA